MESNINMPLLKFDAEQAALFPTKVYDLKSKQFAKHIYFNPFLGVTHSVVAEFEDCVKNYTTDGRRFPNEEPSLFLLDDTKIFPAVHKIESSINVPNLRKVSYKSIQSSGDKKINNGYFHCWGTELYETSESTYYFTVGIIEDVDGKIQSVNPEFIKFENW